MNDDDLRWTWWDNQYGGPGEDEPTEPPRTVGYVPVMTADEIKAALKARPSSTPAPVPDTWARKLGRRFAGLWSKH